MFCVQDIFFNVLHNCTIVLKYSCTFGIWLSRKCLFVQFKLQWNLYSGDTLRTKQVSPDWRLGWCLSTIFVVSHFLSAKVFSEWRLNLGFRIQKKCPFPLNRSVPSREVINKCKDYVTFFSGPNFVSPKLRCPLNRGVIKERFHCSKYLSASELVL